MFLFKDLSEQKINELGIQNHVDELSKLHQVTHRYLDCDFAPDSCQIRYFS